MKVIPFPRKPQITLERESCSVDIALYLDSRPWSLILFIDRQQLCLDYAMPTRSTSSTAKDAEYLRKKAIEMNKDSSAEPPSK